MERDLISSLITCEKVIKAAPKRVMSTDPRNEFTLRNDFTCTSTDGKLFEVFMRVNIKFPFVFSIGLKFRSSDGIITICRYNGKHPHRNKVADRCRLDDFHIHMLYDEQLVDGTDNSMDATATKLYVTFEEALLNFLEDCHIKDWQKFFPDLEEKAAQFRLDGV